MAETKRAELVFIPIPGMGHLVSTMEMAKLLTDRDERLSITVIIMKLPTESKTDSMSLKSNSRIRFIEFSLNQTITVNNFISHFIESHKDPIRDAVAKIVRDETDSIRLTGFVIDMFCTTMIDVANEFGVPTYVFFTTTAAMLGLSFHLQNLTDEQNVDVTEFKDSDVELLIPTYRDPVPAKVFPSRFFDKDGAAAFLSMARRFRETKGIMINTFLDLESYALKFLSDDDKIPPVYPIGPILHFKAENDDNKERTEIMKWLDEQPVSSVVFLCFGSMGYFDGDQVKEIAVALERSGHRFLWSLRKPPPKDRFEYPSEYENPEEVLPEGFLQRTEGTGKVIGWAPQVAVLSHPSVGGFVSHCGWNSTLESVWCGVPIAAWPMYAEQQTNAFELVKDLGIAVEIKMDYRRGSDVIVKAEEIEKGIRRLMEPESETRIKMKQMKHKSRMALMEGGSSYDFLSRFIDNVIDEIA
ncbi:anthocyanidin 3-O-glucosyltransferase 2-like [Olea europaea subsp. europaea]|uniref:Glycosyltransferase n=1 Tax=Olea europaea subsp. europaea TaxID=158383 RepID=A0A8S0TWQ2_OLEEU|nr:anthocyanidin 3-O-glucosyltransferase 2-like [Olea europaea subsp. europaea]